MSVNSKFRRLNVEREGGVLRITLNRPELRNALDETALEELTRAFRGAYNDKSVRVAVLAGAGQDFCAGADISWMRRAADYTQAQSRKDAARLINMCRAVDEAPFPVIAKLHGNCFGGALGLIGASDIVIAETACRFRFSEVRLGIIPAVVSTFVLPKIGIGHARRLYLTSEIFNAQTAKDVGLVHILTQKDNLEDTVAECIDNISQVAPGAVRAAKAYIKKCEELPRAKRLSYSGPLLAKVRSSSEAKEGLSAFLEKRQPKWVKS